MYGKSVGSSSAKVGRGKQMQSMGSVVPTKGPVLGTLSKSVVPTNNNVSHLRTAVLGSAKGANISTVNPLVSSNKLVSVGNGISQSNSPSLTSPKHSIVKRTKHQNGKVVSVNDVKGTALHSVSGSKFKAAGLSLNNVRNGNFGPANSNTSFVPVGDRNSDQIASQSASRSLAHGQTQFHNAISNVAKSLNQNVPKVANGPNGAPHPVGGVPSANYATVGPTINSSFASLFSAPTNNGAHNLGQPGFMYSPSISEKKLKSIGVSHALPLMIMRLPK